MFALPLPSLVDSETAPPVPAVIVLPLTSPEKIPAPVAVRLPVVLPKVKRGVVLSRIMMSPSSISIRKSDVS